ncbi:uncharacterized protein LOC129958238 isoform X2 [Argiope bruennichi]|uniref:uncharacterized protein LOC129958238 isoform X2 n=1 Tax=Argiope bruennichi TaxID=94029 RepID=UPI0024952A63|nr:uncharacterized protein LOC129958238 isoform X2 [Argiope bruennichi]
MEAVILSSWDHIMGPQIQKLWFVNDCKNNLLSEIPCNTLHEFNISKHNKDILHTESKYSPDMEIYSIMCGQLLLSEVDSCKPYDEWASRLYISEYKVIVTVVFHVNTWMNCVNDIKGTKDTCLCFGTIFKCKDLDFVLKNHMFIDHQLRKAVDVMQNSLINFDSMMKTVEEIIRNIILELSALPEENLVSLQNLKYPSFQSFVNSSIISKALTSYLQTSECCVVLGSSEVSVNQDTNKESEFLLEKAFKESLSLTVVDTDLNKVWQTIAIQDPNNMSRYSPSIVSETGQLITQFLNDLAFIQQNGGDAEIFIENFNTFLLSKSASFIKVMDGYRQCKGTLAESEIMTLFGVNNSADLQIFLGIAERLKPGFRTTYTCSF